MMAISTKIHDQAPDAVEVLLPWYATDTLGSRDSRRVEQALAGDADLVREYDAICEERSEMIRLNECLGAPSSRALHMLFAAIDAEPKRHPSPVDPAARIVRLAVGSQ